MTEASRKPSLFVRLAILACAGCMIGGVSGCGWTARDEFYQNRSLVLAPQAGDGSQITSTTTIPGAPLVGLPQVAEVESQRNDRSRQ